MKIDETKYSIANIRDMLRRGELVANKQYQRSPGLWPPGPRTYFIDTVLNGFPFPKMYFHEFLEKTTKRTRIEIVDGQQRITTIRDFIEGKLTLGKNSQQYQGKTFSDLSEDKQDKFLSYTVSVDVIRNAGRVEILQMFRRMNAYTLPLNDAEKRHSEFFGEFRDFVTRLLDRSPILTSWEIFTSRQTLRMSDAEFLADLSMTFENGVGNTTKASLDKFYKVHDQTYTVAGLREQQFFEIFIFIVENLSTIRGTYMTTPPYVFYALCCALFHNRYSIPGLAAEIEMEPIGAFSIGPIQEVSSQLLELAAAHESKDMSQFPQYVQAMSGGSNRKAQRLVRIATICKALRAELHPQL